MNTPLSIESINARLSLRNVANRVHIKLPEDDKVWIESPFRRKRTFTVCRNRLFDGATGRVYGPVELFARAKRISRKRAQQELSDFLQCPEAEGAERLTWMIKNESKCGGAS